MVPVELVTWKPFWALPVWAPPPVIVDSGDVEVGAVERRCAFFWKSVIEPPVMVKAMVALSTTTPTPRCVPLTSG